MKSAVCLLLVQNGKVLSVSRRDEPTRWGLPGGKVDPGETNAEACIREVAEETGLHIFQGEITPLVSMRSVGDVNYWATTYLYTGKPIHDESLKGEEGLLVGWKTFNEVCDPLISPFAMYNRVVFAQYNLYREE